MTKPGAELSPWPMRIEVGRSSALPSFARPLQHLIGFKAISATKPIFVSATLARLLGRTGAFPFAVGTREGQCSGFSGVMVKTHSWIFGRISIIGN